MYDVFFTVIFGLVLGIATSVPIGAMSLYCMKNTMDHSVKLGVVSGMGASLGDFFYALIALFSIGFIKTFLSIHQSEIRIIGGLLIIALSVKVFRSIPLPSKPIKDTTNYAKCASYGFLLTITNPLTFIAFTFIFTSFGVLEYASTPILLEILAISIYLGSVLWWLILSLTIKYIKHRISQEFLTHINKGSGILLFLIGAGSIIATLLK